MNNVFIFAFVYAALFFTKIDSKPTSSNRFFINNPMLTRPMFQGDIKLPNDGRSLGEPTRIWPNGTVPYEIDSTSGYNSSDINTILSAMRYVENRANSDGFQYVKFVPRTIEDSYLRIFNETGCWSHVGQLFSDRPQDLSLMKTTGGSTCITNGIIAHELMHALGFWHEQSRPDRDNYITINWSNIQSGLESQFEIVNASYLGTSYDIKSLMHYDSYAFSSNGEPTIFPKDSTIGFIEDPQTLTDTDVAGIRFLYKSSTTATNTATTTTTTTTTRPTTTTTTPTTTTTTTTTPTTATTKPTTSLTAISISATILTNSTLFASTITNSATTTSTTVPTLAIFTSSRTSISIFSGANNFKPNTFFLIFFIAFNYFLFHKDLTIYF